jgi:hypothetical protein
VLTVAHFVKYHDWREEMRNGKHGLRALALTMKIMLAVMTFTTGGAQAALPGDSTLGSFLVNLGTPSFNNVTAKQLGTGFLLVQARDLKIECTSVDIDFGWIKTSTDAEVDVKFLGCVAKNHAGSPLKDCLFKELETIKASALVLPILHGGERFVLFEPRIGTELANIKFKPETTCTLSLSNPVFGAVAAKVEGELEAVVQTLVFSEAIQLLSGDILKYGALNNTAYLSGVADAELDSGAKLGIH